MQGRARIFFILALCSIGTTLILLNHQKHDPFFVPSLFASEPLKVPPTRDELLTWDQDDPRLIAYIRSHHLKQPSTLPYNMSTGSHKTGFSGMFLKTKKDDKATGTFIEAGAYDGERWSNTLYLEEVGWKGLLVEPNPMLLSTLYSKNRKAWISDVCLSLTNTPQLMNFSSLKEWPASAQLGKPLTSEELKIHGISWAIGKTWTNYELTCFPLYSILKATNQFNNDEVDFLSLDVQGAEIGILKHFPYDKFKIRAIWTEVTMFSEEKGSDLRKFLEGKGYKNPTFYTSCSSMRNILNPPISLSPMMKQMIQELDPTFDYAESINQTKSQKLVSCKKNQT